MVLTMYGTTFDMDVDFVGIVQTWNCASQQVSAHNIWETTWPANIALSLLPLHSQSSSGTTQSTTYLGRCQGTGGKITPYLNFALPYPAGSLQLFQITLLPKSPIQFVLKTFQHFTASPSHTFTSASAAHEETRESEKGLLFTSHSCASAQ